MSAFRADFPGRFGHRAVDQQHASANVNMTFKTQLFVTSMGFQNIALNTRPEGSH